MTQQYPKRLIEVDGRKGNGEPTRKTPWGEIAWQLGGEAAFAKVAQHDAQGISPTGDVIREMLPTGPTLILMDELLNYISSGRKLGMRDQFVTHFAAVSVQLNHGRCARSPHSTANTSFTTLPVKRFVPFPRASLGATRKSQ
jgi:hypothetical protein